jgi:hypothetical protein
MDDSHLFVQIDKHESILMSHYVNQKGSSINNDMNTFANKISVVSHESPSQLKTGVWTQGEQSNMELREQSLSTRGKTNFLQ